MNNEEIVITTVLMFSVAVFVVFITGGLWKTYALLFSGSEPGLKPIPPDLMPPVLISPPPPYRNKEEALMREVKELGVAVDDLACKFKKAERENEGLKSELRAYKQGVKR